MAVPTKKVSELAAEIALGEVARGVFEKNNDNRGERVDEYQNTANGVLGQAWCAKFVYWCFEQAAAELSVKNPMPKIFLVRQFEMWAVREKKITDKPQLGDVLILEHRHLGIISGSPNATGQVPSIEGNTWGGTTFANRKEGVYSLQKHKLSKCTFARLI